MNNVRIFVSEPWNFAVPNTNMNYFDAEIVKRDFQIKSYRYIVIKINNSFVYNENVIEFLFLLKRHEIEDGCFNAYYGKLGQDMNSMDGDLIFTFIVDMQYNKKEL